MEQSASTTDQTDHNQTVLRSIIQLKVNNSVQQLVRRNETERVKKMRKSRKLLKEKQNQTLANKVSYCCIRLRATFKLEFACFDRLLHKEREETNKQ